MFRLPVFFVSARVFSLRDFLWSHTAFCFPSYVFPVFGVPRPMCVEAKPVKTLGGEGGSALPPSRDPARRRPWILARENRVRKRERFPSENARRNDHSVRRRRRRRRVRVACVRNSSGAGGGRPVRRVRANVRRRRTENALASASARVRRFRGSGLGPAADGREGSAIGG